MYASETGRENGQTASGETIREIPRTPEVVTKVDASVEVFVNYPYADDARLLVRRVVLAVGVRAITIIDDKLTPTDAITEDGLHARLGCTQKK